MTETNNNWSTLTSESNGEHKLNGTAYTISGAGPVLVLIHGVGLDRTLWDQHAAALSRDYCVIRHDLPGHGESDPAPDNATLADFADQLARLLDDLGVARAAIAGFSLGALTTQTFIQRHPQRVAKIALLHSVYQRGADSLQAIAKRVEQAETEGTKSLIDAAMQRWFSDEFRAANPDVEEKIRQRLTNNNPAHFLVAYKLFATTDVSLAGKVDGNSIPTLVLTGELDIGSTPAMSQAIADDIPASRLVVLKGQRHMGVVEAADETIFHLRKWLENEHAC